MSKKSKLNYGDDRVKKIRPYANFSKKKKKDISNLFDLIDDYINVDFMRAKDKKSVGTIRIGYNTITDEAGNYRPGIYATADPPNEEPRGGDIWSIGASHAIISALALLKDLARLLLHQ